MTNHWRDIKNADVILINGANPAEAHPVGFQWFMRAKLDPTKGPGKGGGAKIIHTDPRFSRTSAVSDLYLRIRTGTDVAYYGARQNSWRTGASPAPRSCRCTRTWPTTAA